MTSLIIYNFAANIGRELRSFFGSQQRHLNYRGFDPKYIEVKYSEGTQKLIFIMRTYLRQAHNIRKSRIDSYKTYDTFGGLFPHDSS